MSVEFVGIELQLMGEDGVRRALQELTQLANSLGGKKKIDMGLQNVNKQLLAAQANLRAYKKDQEGLVRGSTAWQIVQGYIENTKDEITELNAAAKIARTTFKEMGNTFSQTANTIASRMRQWGGAMQSLGNSLTAMTSPFTRLASGAVIGAGFKAINTITEGLSNGFSRADTMRKFPRVMEAMGYSAEKSQASIQKLEQSVLGLPTGLDEMVTMAQRFTSSMGDIERGTQLAIATNNAFLASMSTDTQRYQGMMQLQDVIGGKDMNAREWASLTNSMLPAIRMMGEHLGYTGKALDEYVASVQRGEIENEVFLQTLIDAGSAADGKIRKVAEESMDTWEAFFSRIRTASSNLMFKGIIEPLDELVNVVTGGKFKSLNLLLDDFIYNGIGKMRNEVAEWIRSHPEEITNFFKDLKSIDIKSFGKGMLEGFSLIAKAIQKFAQVAGNKDLSSLGKIIVYGNIFGRLLTIAGGVVRGSAPLVGKILALLSRVGKLGIFGKIASFFTGLKGAKGLKEATDTVKEVPTFTQSLRKAVSGMSGALKVFGTVALGAGATWLSIKAVRDGIKMLREIAKDFGEMTQEEWIYASGVMAGFGTFVLGLSKLASIVGESMSAVTSLGQFFSLPAIKGGLIIGGIATFITGLVDLNAHFVAGAFRAFKNAVSWLKEGLDGLKEVGKIHVNISKVEKQLDLMRQVMGIFNKPHEADEHSGGSGASMVTRASMVKTMSEIIENTKKAMTDLNTLPEISEQQLEDAKTKVNNTIGALKAIYDELIKPTDSESNISNGSSNYQARTNESIVKGVADIIKSIKDSLADLKELEKIDVELDTAVANATTVGEKMGEIFEKLNYAFGGGEKTNQVELGEEMGGGLFKMTYQEGVTWSIKQEAKNLQEMISAYAETISSIRQAYETIMGGEGAMDFNAKDFADKMDALTNETDGIVPKLKAMFDQLKTGFGDNDVDIQTPMEELAKAIGSIKQMITTMSEIEGIKFTGEEGLGGVITSIGEMVTQLQTAFDPAIVQGVIEQITGFVTVVDTLLTQIQEMQGMSADNPVEVAITINPTGDMGKAVIDKLGEIYDDIYSAWHKIPESLTKTIDIVVNYDTSNVQSFPNLGIPTGLSTGGYIGGNAKVLYRSKGGDIFKPRGTDTVPAMLTPGEYVHNKRAVDFFGIEFMRKINHLDMRGAMNELLAKAGHMANVSRGTVVNNTYNNNQKVIQNINTNSTDFAFRSASRFAGAF